MKKILVIIAFQVIKYYFIRTLFRRRGFFGTGG